MSEPNTAQVGMCIVRAELDPVVGLHVTVITRTNLHWPLGETVFRSTSVEAVLAHVGLFLESFERGDR